MTYISNCCSASTFNDFCRKCKKDCEAICEFCEQPKDEHKCTECECELTESGCNEQHGLCFTCSMLIQQWTTYDSELGIYLQEVVDKKCR